MSANYHAASVFVDWSSAPLRPAPSCSFGDRCTGSTPVGMVLLRVRLLLNALKKGRPNRPQRPLPEEPEDYSEGDSIWDDPALWMLMMH